MIWIVYQSLFCFIFLKIDHIINPPKNIIQANPIIFAKRVSLVLTRYIPNNTNKIDKPNPNKGFIFSIFLLLSSSLFYNECQH